MKISISQLGKERQLSPSPTKGLGGGCTLVWWVSGGIGGSVRVIIKVVMFLNDVPDGIQVIGDFAVADMIGVMPRGPCGFPKQIQTVTLPKVLFWHVEYNGHASDHH